MNIPALLFSIYLFGLVATAWYWLAPVQPRYWLSVLPILAIIVTAWPLFWIGWVYVAIKDGLA